MKIGVLGAGHLGKIHIKCIRQVPQLELVGFYDISPETRESVSKDLDIRAFSKVEDLLAEVDIVDIVTPTPTHYDLAKQAMEAGKHVFLEKPVTETVEQARDLLRMQEEHGVRVQIGHVERFNPAYLAVEKFKLRPMFIEGHRLATFNPRGTDVSVVLDLMIHDLDLILRLVGSEVVEIRAKGVSVVSNSHDICNARLEFANGCVANITASRISLKQMRKLRLFQEDAYVTIDMLDKSAQIITLEDKDPQTEKALPLETPRGQQWITIHDPQSEPNNAIATELQTFYEAISENKPIRVSLEEGYSALSLAHKIIQACDEK